MQHRKDRYFDSVEQSFSNKLDPERRCRYQEALNRCVKRLREVMPVVGLRNPKIGLPDLTWDYCGPFDWVTGFHAGQLWLALQLTGDPVFLNSARARRPVFAGILGNRRAQHHDLGFQFSLSCVAEWQMTGCSAARDLALAAARALLSRYREEGRYLQAWNPISPEGVDQAEFVAGRMIADSMQNVALLYWAFRETGLADFREVADGHSQTTIARLIRDDDTSFHTFVFDLASGMPLRGATHQGYSDASCWSRGQAWMIHGFAQSALSTGNAVFLDTARRLAAKARVLMGDSRVPVWDYGVPDPDGAPRDSSAAAIMASGLYIMARLTSGEEAASWTAFGNRLLDGLLDDCDLTKTPHAMGLLAHGASYVRAGYSDAMLPYGDYYFMEALMRSLGHTAFFW